MVNTKEGLSQAKWWEKASGIIRFYPKYEGKTLKDIKKKLIEVKKWGFDTIEIFAPYYGGNEYRGLDAIDYYRIDPVIGNMKDFEDLVKSIHEEKLKIIAFINLGYCALDNPDFIKACDDLRNGIESSKVKYFLWSETGEEKFDKGLAPHFMNDVEGYWEYNKKAEQYYWVKWKGIDGDTALPQYNFADPGWQKECKNIVDFWMKKGIDGLVIDAVNWYMNCNWEINNKTITEVIQKYHDKYIQPEGAGGFNDDPVLWITKGKYNSVQDYSLNTWWNETDVIGNAFDGDPTIIEKTLQNYRDRVVAAGGVTYVGPNWNKKDRSKKQRILEIATYVTIGTFFYEGEDAFILDLDWPEAYKQEVKKLIKIRKKYSALQAVGDRTRVKTNNDNNFYAFIRKSKDGKQLILVILNYQGKDAEIEVKFDNRISLENVFSGEKKKKINQLNLNIPGYSYRIYEVKG